MPVPVTSRPRKRAARDRSDSSDDDDLPSPTKIKMSQPSSKTKPVPRLANEDDLATPTEPKLTPAAAKTQSTPLAPVDDSPPYSLSKDVKSLWASGKTGPISSAADEAERLYLIHLGIWMIVVEEVKNGKDEAVASDIKVAREWLLHRNQPDCGPEEDKIVGCRIATREGDQGDEALVLFRLRGDYAST